MVIYSCRYPNGDVKRFDYLPEPPPGAEWIFEGSAYSVDKYYLRMPPVEITFQTEDGIWTYMSDKIPRSSNLPPIPDHEGESGDWIIPRDLSTPQIIKPKYRIISYTAKFIDDSGTTTYYFNKNNPLKNIPKVSPRVGYVGEWEHFDTSLQNIIVHAMYVPRKIIYLYDGKELTQLFSERKPPELKDKPGFIRRWNIPSYHQNSHLYVKPEEYPITYKLRFIISEYSSRTVPFNVTTTHIQEPELPKNPGFVAYWSDYNLSIPKDQECHVCYRPVRVVVHMLDGSDIMFDSSKHYELPHIEGYSWPQYEIGSKDIDLYPTPTVYFALFYVNTNLEFIVPFTPTDRHYVDEIINTNTMPSYTRKKGSWTLLKNDDNIEYYVVDYSKPSDRTSYHTLSIDWSVEGLADYLYNEGSIVELDGLKVDLFETDFTKISGINRKNLASFRSLLFVDWLKNEGIQYSDRVHGYSGPRETEKDGLIITLKGKFLVLYNEKTCDAIDELQEYGIMFSEQPFIDATFGSRMVKQLVNMVPVDSYSDKDIRDALEHLYPIHTKIPPFKSKHETSYYKLVDTSESTVSLDLSETTMKKMWRSNEKVITIFNVGQHPELEIDVLDENLKTAAITQYNGKESRYEIPSEVMASDSSNITYSIVELSKNSFANNKSLLSVVIPPTVKVIGYNAFSGCHNLSSIELSEGLEEIGGFAFLGCRKVSSITIPSTVKKMGTSALTSFKEVVVKCPKYVLKGRIVGSNCKLIYLTNNDSELGSDSSYIVNDSDPTLIKFLKKLDECEYEYIEAIINHTDLKKISKSYDKRQAVIEMSINSKYSDICDDDSDLIVDGYIDEEYLEKILDAKQKLNSLSSAKQNEDDSHLDPFILLLKKFVKALNNTQLEYVQAIINGEDSELIAKRHSIRPAIVEMSINELFCEITDDGSELIIDGEIDEDYINQLKEALI